MSSDPKKIDSRTDVSSYFLFDGGHRLLAHLMAIAIVPMLVSAIYIWTNASPEMPQSISAFYVENIPAIKEATTLEYRAEYVQRHKRKPEDIPTVISTASFPWMLFSLTVVVTVVVWLLRIYPLYYQNSGDFRRIARFPIDVTAKRRAIILTVVLALGAVLQVGVAWNYGRLLLDGRAIAYTAVLFLAIVWANLAILFFITSRLIANALKNN